MRGRRPPGRDGLEPEAPAAALAARRGAAPVRATPGGRSRRSRLGDRQPQPGQRLDARAVRASRPADRPARRATRRLPLRVDRAVGRRPPRRVGGRGGPPPAGHPDRPTADRAAASVRGRPGSVRRPACPARPDRGPQPVRRRPTVRPGRPGPPRPLAGDGAPGDPAGQAVRPVARSRRGHRPGHPDQRRPAGPVVTTTTWPSCCAWWPPRWPASSRPRVRRAGWPWPRSPAAPTGWPISRRARPRARPAGSATCSPGSARTPRHRSSISSAASCGWPGRVRWYRPGVRPGPGPVPGGRPATRPGRLRGRPPRGGSRRPRPSARRTRDVGLSGRAVRLRRRLAHREPTRCRGLTWSIRSPSGWPRAAGSPSCTCSSMPWPGSEPGLGLVVFVVVAGATCLLAGRLDRLASSRLTVIVGLLGGGAVGGLVLGGGAVAAIAQVRTRRDPDGRPRCGPRGPGRPARVHPGRLDPRSRRGGPAVLPRARGAGRGLGLRRCPGRAAPIGLPRRGRGPDPGLPGRRPGSDRPRPLGPGCLGRRVRSADEPDLAGGPGRHGGRRRDRRAAGRRTGSSGSWRRSSPGRCRCRSLVVGAMVARLVVPSRAKFIRRSGLYTFAPLIFFLVVAVLVVLLPHRELPPTAAPDAGVVGPGDADLSSPVFDGLLIVVAVGAAVLVLLFLARVWRRNVAGAGVRPPAERRRERGSADDELDAEAGLGLGRRLRRFFDRRRPTDAVTAYLAALRALDADDDLRREPRAKRRPPTRTGSTRPAPARSSSTSWPPTSSWPGGAAGGSRAPPRTAERSVAGIGCAQARRPDPRTV